MIAPSMTRVALILSLSHSGSTLLDLILGSHSQCVGLGELHNALRLSPARLEAKFGAFCTCGAKADACEFWGPLGHWLGAHAELSTDAKLARALRHFTEVFGSDKLLVDSSKKTRMAAAYRRIPKVELQLIHLLKDVRSYAVSALDRRAPGERSSIRSLQAFRSWHRKNQRIQRAARAANLPRHQIGYEDLCGQPEASIARLCEFLAIGFEPDMLGLPGRNSHLISGNRVRNEPERRQRISYDDRWLHRKDWKLAALLSPGIMRYNAREVYGPRGEEP